jgi:hypothetical protein
LWKSVDEDKAALETQGVLRQVFEETFEYLSEKN